MLSHVRKIIEKAVIEELEEITVTDRMQYGFQNRVSTLQAAISIAAKLETDEHLMSAILDLTKAYDRVSRKIIIKKLEQLGVPIDLINQILIFLLPIHVTTTGDVTSATAIITIGLTQGGTASPALFRLYINDLAGRLIIAAGKDIDGNESHTFDPRKLVEDDVILVANSKEQLQKLLEVCSARDTENELSWKPSKCAIVVPDIEKVNTTFTLANQEVPFKTSATYLGLTISCRGFKKEVNDTLEQKCRRAYSSIIGHPFFTTALPLKTIGNLYRMNVRSILMYGAMLSTNVHELVELDEKLLN